MNIQNVLCNKYLTVLYALSGQDKLNTRHFLVGPKVTERFDIELEKGKRLNFVMLAKSKVEPETGERQVFFELNGQSRYVYCISYFKYLICNGILIGT